MPTKLTTNTTYQKLLSKLKSILIEGLKKIEEEKVRTYWRTGQLISNYILQNKERADYGENLFDKLAEDLGIDVSTLQRTVQFYRAFPISAALRKLSWMHYVQLITVKNEQKRKLFAERAAKKEWSYRELSEAVRLDRLKIEEPKEKSVQSTDKLSVTRPRLFTYQVLEPAFIHPIEERLVIDLGFKVIIHAEIKGIRLKQDELIESQKSGDAYSFKHSDATKKELYAYKALVERVVDGDTIWLNIDLGFSCWTRQKVRLRGIDCPELDTKKGQEAKEFVEARLKEVDFVLVKTHKSDKYERYLTDVFYLAGEENPQRVLEEGIFLNQELLDLGLAKISD